MNIYALIDPETNKIRYIGQTINVKRRYRQHLSAKDTNKHKFNWINSLKSKNLKPLIKVIGIYDRSIIDNMERFWIDYCKRIGCKLVNCDSGGNGKKVVSEETRKKISMANKGKTNMLGYRHTEECKKLMSETRKGIKQSQETIDKRKMFGAKNPFYGKGPMKNKFGKYHHASKSVIKIDIITNNIINIYQSISEASKLSKVSRMDIGLVCNNKKESAGGFKWEFSHE